MHTPPFPRAQRYWHNENVGLLPFRDAALSRSVGATAAELNREPIDPIAAEIIFDAISSGKLIYYTIL